MNLLKRSHNTTRVRHGHLSPILLPSLLLTLLAPLTSAAIAFGVSSGTTITKKNTAPAVRISSIAEKHFEIEWDSLPGAASYNVYTAPTPELPLAKRLKVNTLPIESGTRFVFIWQTRNGERVRSVKGERHCLSVAALGKDGRPGTLSNEVCNCYFDKYGKVLSTTRVNELLVTSQKSDTLPLALRSTSAAAFGAFMERTGATLAAILADSIDFSQTGACVPVSAIVVKLLNDHGINAVRVEGTFVREWHMFVIVKIDHCEYVLDFTTDQFVPGTLPVLLPRDSCHLSPTGVLGGSGERVYDASRVFNVEQSELIESPQTQRYAAIYRLAAQLPPATADSVTPSR